MRNPFDDHSSVGRSTNPFDSLRDGSSSEVLGDAASSSAFGGGGGVSTTPNEPSWQDLGDLPYRRVRMHDNITWGWKRGEITKTTQLSTNSTEEQIGLSWYPKTYVDTVRAHQAAVIGNGSSNPLDSLRGGAGVARLLATTTTTFVAGCPNGGPIASVTVPLATGGAGFGPYTTIRIMNNAGAILSSIQFPPRDLALIVQQQQNNSNNATTRISLNRTPGDILTIGFTSRCVLVVVLRDSLTLCYDLAGNAVLPPFFALSHNKTTGSGGIVNGIDLLEARVFAGGVAVLGVDMNSAVVELLDEYDDPVYADGADISMRRIVPLSLAEDVSSTMSTSGTTSAAAAAAAAPFLLAPPPHYALVTPLPTGMFARSRHLSYQCIAILPRQYAPTSRPELFLSTSDGSVVIAELNPSTSATDGITDINCRSRMGGSDLVTIVSMAFAPNGRFLACFTSNSILTVVSTSFESKVLEFDARSGSTSPPRFMGWCGEDSVILHWKNLGVLMVGPYGDFLRFPYDDGSDGGGGNGNDPTAMMGAMSGIGAEVHLIPEIDCCRVIRSSSVEILQRVPPIIADLLRIGSIEPGALLLDASESFDSGSPTADETARSIIQHDGLLEEAIHQCVEAAVGEFDIKNQKRMLRAASYGLHFACKDKNFRNKTPGRPSPEAVSFVNAARKIRVLNALRKPSTGFCMTSSQYDAVGPKGVVARLVVVGKASSAASIADYLKLGRRVSDYAKAMKASAYVSSSISRNVNMTDSQIAEEVIRIISGEEKSITKLLDNNYTVTASPPSTGMYASVALAAHRSGRKGVADLLIMLEQSPADKVQALLAIGSYADAAAVSCRVRDPDLIHTCISAYHQSLPKSDEGKSQYFSGIINKFPLEAISMFTAYYARLGGFSGGDARPYINILLRRQKHADAALNFAKKALRQTKPNDPETKKVEMMKEASKIFELAGKDCAFHKTCTDEQITLIADQEQLRLSYGSMEVAPPTTSVTSTMMSIIKYAAVDPRSGHRLQSDFDRIGKKYKVPEKRQWYVKVRALSESGQWAALRNFAESRAKPPIGMKPFAQAAIYKRQGQAEIMYYIERMTDKADSEARYDLFCEAGIAYQKTQSEWYWKKALEESVKLGDGRKIANVKSMCNSPDIQRLCDKYIV